ncbi:MAG: hypothetical protein E7096_09700 [Bacteroides sp.]|nr:hypothetical protein [Bacteroides sp.]
MKTKHLLTALALPALFAACTADDIESVSVNQTERVALNENFKLNFGGVESRLSAGKPGEALAIDFEVNDKVGGAIVDTYDGTSYTVVDYVSTNHPFVNDGSSWNIEHTMVEGNYLFYYPYNENNHSRSAASYSIPVMQELTDKVTGEFNPKAAIEKYAMAVGHQFLDKEDLSASVELAPIFSYARLVLKLDNTYAGGEVDKVVLQAAEEDAFQLNGQISNKKVSEIFAAIEKADDNDEVDAIWAANKQTANFALDAKTGDKDNAYYKEELNKTSKVMVGKVPAGVSLKVDAQNNKTFETYMVMPAQTVDSDLKVYLYMTDGRVFVNDDASFSSDLIFNRNTPKKVEVSMVKSESVPYIVTSEEDWNDYVAMMGKTPADFIIAGEDFTITNTIKYPTAKEAVITVKSALKITGDNVTMKNVKAEGVVTVAEGAVLNTNETAEYAKIDNEGTLNIKKVTDKDGDVEVYNLPIVYNNVNATLNVEDDAEVAMYLLNENETKTEDMAHGLVVNNGTITFSENSSNAGEIINNGALTGSLTNNATYTNVKDKDIKFTPSITNNGEIFASDAWNNKGLIINAKDAEITVSKFGSAAFNNAGVMKLAEGSHCLITDNAGGELILAALNQSGWAVENANGTIAYTTQASDAGKAYDFETTGKGITKIYVNGNLGITKKGALSSVVVEKDATLAMPKGETIAYLEISENVDAIVNAYDDENAAYVTTLKVNEGATLTINKDNTFQCETVKNEGTVYVGGSFIATETTPGDAEAQTGKYKTTATTGSISFNGQTAADKEAAAKAAVFQNFIQTYVDNGSAVAVSQMTWASITATNINNESEWATSSTEWVKEAVEKFVKDYNTAFGLVENETEATTDDPITKASFETILAETANKTYFDAGLKAVKDAADAKIGDAIKAVIKNNNWLASNVVYEASEAGYTINEVVNGTTMMITDFVTAVKAIKKTAADKEVPGSVWLSLQDVTTARYWNATTEKASNTDEIPSYSYIENYEGSYLYKVLKLMKEFTYTAPTGAKEWQTALAAAASGKTATIEGVIAFYNEVYKIYKDADAKLTDDLVLGPKVKAIADEAATVVEWKYTDAQIVKAVIDGNFGTTLGANGAQFN